MTRSRLHHHLPSATFMVILTGLVLAALGLFVYLGFYNIAADAPHTRFVYAVIESLRDQSIATRARGISVPQDLASPQRIVAGGSLYGEMCAQCHLGPGVENSELRQGLYPQAPELAKVSDRTPAEQFWIIKHGIKLTAMPAWGKTHPDPLIWNMVAFIRKLPGMSAEEYKRLTAAAAEDHDQMMKQMGHDQEMKQSGTGHAH